MGGTICDVEKCLCLSLRTGCLVFGLFNFFLAVFTFGFAIYVQNYPELLIEVDKFGEEDPNEESLNRSTVTTVIILSFAHILASIFLITGAIARNRAALNIWKVYSIIFGIFFFLDNFMDTFEKFIAEDHGGAFGVLLQTVVTAFMWSYMVAVIGSFMIQIKQEEAVIGEEEIYLKTVGYK